MAFGPVSVRKLGVLIFLYLTKRLTKGNGHFWNTLIRYYKQCIADKAFIVFK